MAKQREIPKEKLLELLDDVLTMGGWSGSAQDKQFFLEDFSDWRKRAAKLIWGKCG